MKSLLAAALVPLVLGAAARSRSETAPHGHAEAAEGRIVVSLPFTAEKGDYELVLTVKS